MEAVLLDLREPQPLEEVQRRIEFFHINPRHLAGAVRFVEQLVDQVTANARIPLRRQNSDIDNSNFVAQTGNVEPPHLPAVRHNYVVIGGGVNFFGWGLFWSPTTTPQTQHLPLSARRG